MAQRGFPGIHAGEPPIQQPERGLLEGRAAQARSKGPAEICGAAF